MGWKVKTVLMKKDTDMDKLKEAKIASFEQQSIHHIKSYFSRKKSYTNDRFQNNIQI